MSADKASAIGIDFGTTNSVVARANGEAAADLVSFAGPDGPASVFRSALCFWQVEDARGGLAHEAGPWAIAEFLEFPQGSRFLQSFKSVAANPNFEHASVFEARMRFEELGQIFLSHLRAHGGDALADLPERIVVGRPCAMSAHGPIRRSRERATTRCSRPWADRSTTFTSRLAPPTASPRG